MTLKSTWMTLVLVAAIAMLLTFGGLMSCSDSDKGTGSDDNGDTLVKVAPEISGPIEPINEDGCSGRMECVSLPITGADSVASSQGGSWGNNMLCWKFTEDFDGVDTVIAVNSYGADTCVLEVSMTLEEGPEITCPSESIDDVIIDGETICVSLPITGADSVISSQSGIWENDTLCWTFTEEFTKIDTVIAVNSCGADTCVLEVNESALPVMDYEGTLRLYVVEPTSRWNDKDSEPYNFGFLEFALDSAIIVTGSTQVSLDITWDGLASGWDNITEDNIMVIAALFNSESHQTYVLPSTNRWPFQANYVDAAAGAAPGTTDSNKTSPSTTHTVFAEEATATWCTFCPVTRHWLHEVYKQGHNFYYVALVDDENSAAAARLRDQYNSNDPYAGYPATFFDGGDDIVLGGLSPEGPYIDAMNAAGSRTVRDINLVISVDWLGEGKIRIVVSVEL